MLVLKGQIVDLCVRMEVELLVVNNSVALLRQVAKLIAQFNVLPVSEAGRVVHFFHGVFEKLINTIGQVLT